MTDALLSEHFHLFPPEYNQAAPLWLARRNFDPPALEIDPWGQETVPMKPTRAALIASLQRTALSAGFRLVDDLEKPQIEPPVRTGLSNVRLPLPPGPWRIYTVACNSCDRTTFTVSPPIIARPLPCPLCGFLDPDDNHTPATTYTISVPPEDLPNSQRGADQYRWHHGDEIPFDSPPGVLTQDDVEELRREAAARLSKPRDTRP